MSSGYDDEEIEFDFFDEPETVEATQRRRLPRLERVGGRGGGEGGRPPRPPLRAPTGLVPLARLVGLVAIAIALVVGLVFWVGSCQGKSKQDEYRSYVEQIKPIAAADRRRGVKFANGLAASGLKQSELVATLQQYAQQEQQAYAQAQQIRPPGPLRASHANLVDSLELRAKGLAELGDTLAAQKGTGTKAQGTTAAALARNAKLLTASDVVWEQLYRQPATQTLTDEGVRGVVIPSSQFVTNPELVSLRSFQVLERGLAGASTGGTPSGLHGDQLNGVRVTPQGVDLSTSTPTKVTVSSDLAFVATVENSGHFDETHVVVSLSVAGTKIAKQRTIPLIGAGQTRTVAFTNFNLPASAFRQVDVKVVVHKVPGEVKTDNNSATYPVLFTLSQP